MGRAAADGSHPNSDDSLPREPTGIRDYGTAPVEKNLHLLIRLASALSTEWCNKVSNS